MLFEYGVVLFFFFFWRDGFGCSFFPRRYALSLDGG